MSNPNNTNDENIIRNFLSGAKCNDNTTNILVNKNLTPDLLIELEFNDLRQMGIAISDIAKIRRHLRMELSSEGEDVRNSNIVTPSGHGTQVEGNTNNTPIATNSFTNASVARATDTTTADASFDTMLDADI
mgnify:CR=1 FL=1